MLSGENRNGVRCIGYIASLAKNVGMQRLADADETRTALSA